MCNPRMYRIAQGEFSRPFIAVAALLFLSTSSLVAEATPMSFRFDTEISNIVPLTSAGVPFPLEVGDHISGKFTFEPLDVDSSVPLSETVQSLGVEFTIGSQLLESSQYALQAWNDVPVLDTTGSFKDQLLLACSTSGYAACVPDLATGAENFRWGFTLTLVGDNSVLDGADISQNPEDWSDLAPGTLSLVFRQLDGSERALAFSQIASFRIVPEPGVAILLVQTYVGILLSNRMRRRRTRC